MPRWSHPANLTALLRETPFQRQVIDTARLLGWLVFHVHDSRTVDQARGRRGATQRIRTLPFLVGSRGFPDLVLVRPPRVIFAELKAEDGAVSEHQRVWIDWLMRCPGVEVYLWRPRDRDDIERILAA